MLTPVEKFWLGWHSAHGSAPAARRAQMILQLEAGALSPKPDAAVSLQRQFETHRLGAVGKKPVLTRDELLAAAGVDLAHARQVAAHALQLFDLTQARHQLPAADRPLLETAALLHNLGLEVDAPKHHTAGRDLLMAVRLAAHSPTEQRQLACLIRFHRKTARPRKEPLFTALPRRRQPATLVLAALLRIADGLDYSQSQTTRIEALHLEGEALTLTLAGPHAETDGARALEKADLWGRLFDQEWALTPAPADLAALSQVALEPETPLARVAARALADQWRRWEAAADAAQAGQPLALKNTRAAARRARAALALLQPYLKAKPTKALSRQLKRVEENLAAVRDWEVLIEQARQAAGGEAWPFLDDWQAAHAAALTAAVIWLAGPEAGATRAALAAFAAEPPARRKYPGRVADDAAPLLLAQVDVLTDLAAALDETNLATYHALRRQGVKRCRFALEFFEPALGEPAQRLIKDLVRVQDRLGALNDACVAIERLNAWLAEHAADPAARGYQAYNADIIRTQLRKFQRAWPPVEPDALRGRIQALVRRLLPPEAAEPAPEPPEAADPGPPDV
ncbi:MAG: CHAD domain-containing protein [Anaerolineales bacterium]|nr:CHAD domain-containing protein [Anaerolineales bacterium]